MYKERIKADFLLEKVITAEQAAEMIEPNSVIGFSGFAAVGYPKVIPQAIATLGKATNLMVIAGASAGDELDGALSRSELMVRRTPFNVNKDARERINTGKIYFTDEHLGHVPQIIRSEAIGHVDYAIVECSSILSDGSVVPTLSVGASEALISYADHVLLELNMRHPAELCGIHDIFSVGRLPNQAPLSVTHAGERIGTPSIKCDPSKIAGIVLAVTDDQEPRFVSPSEVSEKIAGHIIEFLKTEIKAGRLPQDFTFQSGFGAVANAVLYGLNSEEFGQLSMYTEVVQDGALQLLVDGKIKAASATSFSLSSKGRKMFYENLETLKQKVVLRPQDISNNCGIIRRLGVVAMNTAIEIDIYGNVNSTHIMGSSMMNGIGGSGDYARNGAISIFMTPSTAKNGAISSIVPMVSHVDHTEHDVQIVVTEYGYADLRGKAPRERAELMIENCCHPDYKEMLKDYYEHAKEVAPGQHTPHDLKEALSWHQRYLETGNMKKTVDGK